MPRKPKVRWDKVNFKRPVRHLAEKLGVTPTTVWVKKQQFAPELCTGVNFANRFRKADWKQRNEDIAKKFGVSSTMVSAARAALGKPRQPRKAGSGRKSAAKCAYNPRLSVAENAKKMGLCYSTTWHYKAKLDKEGVETVVRHKAAPKRPAARVVKKSAKTPKAINILAGL